MVLKHLNDHASDLRGRIDLSGALSTSPLISNRMTYQHYRCLKLVNPNPAFCLRDNILSDVRPPGEIELPK